MKRVLLLVVLIMGLSTVQAQIDGGTMLAGGSATFNHYSNKDLNVKSTYLSIQPQFGLAFADNFVAGAWFSFSSFTNVSSWSVAPFLRYYMKNFFIQTGYGYSRTGDVGQSLFDLELGYAMFLNDYVALEPALYYNQYFNDGFAGNDLGAKIGFQIYFNR
jgi:hypothetical protein